MANLYAQVVKRLRPSKVESLCQQSHHRLVGGLVGDLLEAFVSHPGKHGAHPPDLVAAGPDHHLVKPGQGMVLARAGDAEGLDPVLRLDVSQTGLGRHSVFGADQVHAEPPRVSESPTVVMGDRIRAASSGGHPWSTSWSRAWTSTAGVTASRCASSCANPDSSSRHRRQVATSTAGPSEQQWPEGARWLIVIPGLCLWTGRVLPSSARSGKNLRCVDTNTL